MADLMQWLSEPFGGSGPFDKWSKPAALPENPTRLQVYAALYGISHGCVTAYGIITSGGPYGRTGLHQYEAFAFWELRAFVGGWLEGTEHAERELLHEAVTKEYLRVKAWNEARELEDAGEMPLEGREL